MFKQEFRKSIRYKFLKDISIILFVGTCLTSAVIGNNVATMLTDSLTSKGMGLASTIAKRNENALIMSGNIQLTSVYSELITDEEIIYTVIRNNEGKILTTQFESINYKWPGLKDVLPGLSKDIELPDILAAIKNHVAVKEVSVPIMLGVDTLGNVTIGMSEHKIHAQAMKTVFFIVALNFLVTFVLGLVLFITSKKTILDPIIELGHSAARFAKGDLSTRISIKTTGKISVQGRDEIGTLAEGFNEMLDQIQKRDTELMQHREHLEDLVTMRAAELVNTNEQLQQELAERKKAEERLDRYARELKENNEELKTFAYIASHDLRTPLVNMEGFAGELRYALRNISSVINDVLPALDDNNRTKLLTAFLKDVPEALGFIESSAGRMEELINALSRLSRLGRQELKLEVIQVQTIVQSVLKDMQLMIDKNGIKVAVGPLPEIVADRNSLQVILGSILDNAVKYLRPEVPGEIGITAERNAEGSVFSISDNGRGIPNEEIPKVFEMFRQVGEQNTPGEGVGLACAKTLVRRHGGRIWCESTPGVGTTFHFTIPENVEFPDQSSVEESRSPRV